MAHRLNLSIFLKLPNQQVYSGRTKKFFSKMGSKNRSSALFNTELGQTDPTDLTHIDDSNYSKKDKKTTHAPKFLMGISNLFCSAFVLIY